MCRGVAPLVYLGLYDAVCSFARPSFSFAALAPLATTRLRCTFPSQACTPNSQRLCSQRAPLPTPNRRRSNNCNLCALSCGANQYMPVHVNSYSAPQALPPLRPALKPYPYPCVCASVRPSIATCVHLNSARHYECVRGTLCLHHVASCIRCHVDAARWHSAAKLRRHHVEYAAMSIQL